MGIEGEGEGGGAERLQERERETGLESKEDGDFQGFSWKHFFPGNKRQLARHAELRICPWVAHPRGVYRFWSLESGPFGAFGLSCPLS